MKIEQNKFDEQEIIEIFKAIEPMVNIASKQTNSKYKEELVQHLYELSLKSLRQVDFHKPKSLFKIS